MRWIKTSLLTLVMFPKNGPSMDARIPTLQFVRQRWESRGRPSYTIIFVNALTRSKVARWRFYSGKHWQRSSTDSMEKKFSRKHKQKQNISNGMQLYTVIKMFIFCYFSSLYFSKIKTRYITLINLIICFWRVLMWHLSNLQDFDKFNVNISFKLIFSFL